MLRSGAVSLNAATAFHSLLTGVDPGFENQKLVVTGTVSLGNSQLVLERLGGPLPSPGAAFVLIDNDGADVVGGTFAGLPENSQFNQLGMRWRINYAGGDGNDVAITLLELLPIALGSFSVQPGTGVNAGRDVAAISGTGIPGASYVVQRSSDLLNWTNHSSTLAAPITGAFSIQVVMPPGVARSCLRVQRQ
jgi:hypothetical protein